MPGPFIGSYGALGYAKEVTLGTPLAAAAYVPFKEVSIEKDPGLFDIKLARQQRELTTYVQPGEQQLSGKSDFSLFSVMGMALVVGAIGFDQYQTGSSPTNATTLAAAPAAGATTISTTATFTVNDIIQIDTAVSLKAECRKVTAVTGAGPFTVTLDVATTYAHSNGVAVSKVVAPFTHAIAQQNAVNSFTLEKNLGGLTSVQYAGAVANKLTLKGATKEEVSASIDWIAQKDAQISTTTPVYTTDAPIVLAGVSASLLGSGDANVDSFQLDIDNMIKPIHTYSGQRYPTYLPATGRQITLKVTEPLQSMTYYNDLPAANATTTPVAGAAVLTLVSGTDQVVLTLPQVSIQKYSDPMKVGDIIEVDITFKAWLGANANSMSASVINSQYLGF